MTAPALDPDRLARLRATIAENARVLRELAPAVADDFAALAQHLETICADPPSPPPPRPTPLPKHNGHVVAMYRATAAAWIRHRVASWPQDNPIPSIADDIADAKAFRLATPDGRKVPDRFIREARFPGWRQPVGRPPKSVRK